ncbi:MULTISPECIES: hypothetical protein [unclassified Photobacterium]|uniref:hypothetical protein n=1 Tax=unclassified Photobacterium TaxID=2628852 RepID=UPI000D15A0FD|nr:MULTISPECIES: hypothetical protein [unclassified Photobacterium]PSV27021.1 hypothetical protein C9J42_09130 [Photobacterium sp. GB-56]PSV30297.1 hypothetical protein C9J40_13520 [Photobacterium sp. GB-72]PSV37347.1 hypothetical protein C9J38_11310 [Photobacterium sp. GB-210]PSV41936.1 hypothetical protein C9J46_16130 [Photobacterium sp. GB-36]PSV54248.1 hypothetical protein C9J45_05650 [Photobacterium sp. GB-1]
MKLRKDKRCYTDLCINGKWFHHDHCTNTAYMLKGGDSPLLELARIPQTESELIGLLEEATLN